MSNDLIDAMANLEEDRAIDIVRKKIEDGETAFDIVEQCRKGVEIVGKKYSEGKYYLSDLIMSEAIFKEVMDIIEPHFPKNGTESHNGIKVIMGTIQGDIHDLGKNIVIYLLRSSGYSVYDLGVDVPPERFVEAIEETGARIVGVCVLLTFCIGYVKELVDLLEETGLREKVTVVVGGYPVDEQVRKYTGVDYVSNDGVMALDIFERIADSLKK
ncbi:MAG: cobalamin-dependent protein [Thermacetogeniaceae bacterium]|jgi:methylmalonyl-CoA mutase cobalamin-binding domain/chain|nr:cobalamin-binding protein [Syntrophomonadaceae bacterium]